MSLTLLRPPEIKPKPDNDNLLYNQGNALFKSKHYEEAIDSFNKALKIQPGDHYIWYNRGIGLGKLGNFKEAICLQQRFPIASFDKALELKPDYAEAFYNKACCYGLQGNVDLAIENLQQAINLNPEEYWEWAKNDLDFNSIRDSEQFQALIQEESDWEDGEIDEMTWLRAAATNPVFDFLKDPEEDIYTLADSEAVATQGASGKPFND